MTERRAKSRRLLINCDLEFYVLNRYIMRLSCDLMISRMCLSLALLEKCQVEKITVVVLMLMW